MHHRYRPVNQLTALSLQYSSRIVVTSLIVYRHNNSSLIGGTTSLRIVVTSLIAYRRNNSSISFGHLVVHADHTGKIHHVRKRK